MQFYPYFSYMIIAGIFFGIPVFLLYHILKKFGVNGWYALLYIPFSCIAVYLFFGVTPFPKTGPNTEARGFKLSVARLGLPLGYGQLYYINDNGKLFKLVFSLRKGDLRVRAPGGFFRTGTFVSSFEMGGTNFFLKKWQAYKELIPNLGKYPELGLKEIKNIIEKTEFGNYISEQATPKNRNLYLHQINVYHLDAEHLTELDELLKNSGFEEFSHDYSPSPYEKSFGRPHPLKSRIEMIIPQYGKKVRAYDRKMPDGFRRIYEWVEKQH